MQTHAKITETLITSVGNLCNHRCPGKDGAGWETISIQKKDQDRSLEITFLSLVSVHENTSYFNTKLSVIRESLASVRTYE